MHPRTPLESSKDRPDRRRSLRLRSDSRTRAAPVPPEQSAERSPAPPSPQKTKKRRPSTLQDVTNIISGKRSSASLSASDSDSVHTSKRTKNRMEHTAVTPMTTASTVTSPAVTTGVGPFLSQPLTQLKIALEPTHLPEGVVDIFNPRDNTKPCTCDENHCSSQSLSHTFLCHYGRDYAQSLQNWERAYFPPRTTTTMDGSSTASSASSFHAEASSLSQGTPPGRVNYVIGSLAAEEEHSLDPSISSQLLRHQPHLSEKMRAVLVDWLIELSEEYHLSPRSLHLAITLINRSLECGNDDESEGETLVIQRDMFQCLGCACMWMASKMEEITSPSVDDFVYISADSYSRLDITEMEMAVCDALKFRLYQVTPHDFVEQYLRASMANRRLIGCPVLENHVERSMVEYLLELSFLPYELVTVAPSKIAAAAMYLARVVLGLPGWTPTLEHASGLCQWDLEDTVLIIYKYYGAAEESKLANAFTKYSKKKHHFVALKTVPLEQNLGF